MNRVLRPILALLLTGALLLPAAVMLSTALKSNQEAFLHWSEFRWVPDEPQWENLTGLKDRLPGFAVSLRNSAVVAIGATLLALLAAIPAAYALARLRFRGRRTALLVVLCTQMFSPVVLVVSLYKMYASIPVRAAGERLTQMRLPSIPAALPESLIDTHTGLILINAALGLAFAVWLLAAYFAALPHEIEEAARVDGCSLRQMLWHIMLPLSAPGIVTAAVFVFVAAWNEFLLSLTLITTPAKKTVVTTLFGLAGQYEVQWNLIMAGALLAVLPVVALFAVAERHLVQGLTAGALK